MYVLLVRPQQRKVRDQRDLVRRVGVGAEVQTIGGILGRVVAADDEYVHLEISPGVVVTFVRAAVGRILEAAPEEEYPEHSLGEHGSYSSEGDAEHGAGDHAEPAEHAEHAEHSAQEPPEEPGATGTGGGAA